jgi:hypothetical protein
MAVLQLVPDLPPSAEAAGVDAVSPQPEVEVAPAPAVRMAAPIITPPRVDAAILMPFLRMAAELALRATGAAGSAVAMRSGSGFRCFASVGDAPPANAPVRLAGTLTGQCVRKGRTVRCDDVACDDTPELSAYSAQARSILLAPIIVDGNVGGVIGLFSPEPYAFLAEHAGALEQVAGVIGVALLHSERLVSSAGCMTLPSGGSGFAQHAEPVRHKEEHPARVLEGIAEGIARAVSHALLRPQPPALSAGEAALDPASGPAARAPRKSLYGLPCSGCGAYFASTEAACPVCNLPRSGS